MVRGSLRSRKCDSSPRAVRQCGSRVPTACEQRTARPTPRLARAWREPARVRRARKATRGGCDGGYFLFFSPNLSGSARPARRASRPAGHTRRLAQYCSLNRANVWRAAKVSWLRSATLRQDAVRGGPEAPPYPNRCVLRAISRVVFLRACVPREVVFPGTAARPARRGRRRAGLTRRLASFRPCVRLSGFPAPRESLSEQYWAKTMSGWVTFKRIAALECWSILSGSCRRSVSAGFNAWTKNLSSRRRPRASWEVPSFPALPLAREGAAQTRQGESDPLA